MTHALAGGHFVLAASLSSGSTAGFAIAFLVAFLVALWISMVVWTFRDIRSRTQDVILQVFGTALTAVFPVVGILIYLIVRPRQTLADLYERQLEEESLLAEMTERQTCPTCHYRVEPDFQICPSCATKLRRACPRCDRLLELKWNACPYCGYGASEGGRSAPRSGARAADR
jgi:RNA polymerase subunit RPABC4/transcription elongation factor Spt4